MDEDLKTLSNLVINLLGNALGVYVFLRKQIGGLRRRMGRVEEKLGIVAKPRRWSDYYDAKDEITNPNIQILKDQAAKQTPPEE